MATIGELNIALGGDASQFERAIKTGKKNLEELSRAFTVAGKDAQKFNLGMLNVLQKQQGEIGKYSARLKEDLGVIAQGLADQGKVASTSEKGIRNMAAAEIVRAQKTREAAEATKMAEKAAKEYEMQLKSVSNSIWLMNTALRQIGISLTAAFTVPFTAAGVAAVKTFTDWERGTVSIQRAAEITRAEAESITQSFIEISQQVPLTVQELQKAGFAAGQAGITGAEAIENFAVAAAKLAKVGGDAFKDLPIENVADQLAKLSTAFGVAGDNMEEVERVASTLLGVAKDVPGGLNEIVEGMRRVSGFAANAGLNIETTAALIGSLVAAAVPASRAGTELGRVISQMNKEVVKLSEVLGYGSEGVAELKQRMDDDLNGVLLETIQRMSAIESATDRAIIANEIFGEVGAKALLPLVNNTELVSQLLERASYEFEDGTLLAKEFDAQANSLGGTFQVFRNNVQALAKALGDDLAPYVNYIARVMIDFLQKAVAGWKALNPTVKTAVIGLAALLAILGPLTLAFNTLVVTPISGFVTLITFANKLRNSLGALTGLITLGSRQMQLMQAASIAAAGGNASLATSMLAASTASKGLIASLGTLLLELAPLIAALLAVVGVVALLAKSFGVGIKFKLPTIEQPEYENRPNAASKLPQITPEELLGSESLLDAEKEAGKQREKEIEKELKEKKKLRDRELDAINDQIKDYEKVRKAETKALQELVDQQRDALDARKDLWEEEREGLEDQIDAQEDLVDAAKDAAKEAKKTLSAIKKSREGEIDAAEGQVKLAEASLDAAQEALKREILLGRDEYDASYRSAEERVRVAEEAVLLAKQNVVKLERLQDAEIAAQEQVVENAEAQVDVQQDALDALKDALDERKKIVDDEIDILQDELDIRQDALSDYRDATNEKLDLLREERDDIKDGYDEEIDLIQERLDAIREQNQAIADMGLPELPQIPDAFADFYDELNKQTADLKNLGGALKFDPGGLGLEIEEGGGADLLRQGKIVEGLKKGFYNAGRTITTPILDTLFGKGFTANLEAEAVKNGTSVGTELWRSMSTTTKILFGQTPLGALLFAQSTYFDLQERAEKAGVSIPEYIRQGMVTKFSELSESIQKTIYDGLWGEGSYEALQEEANRRGQGIPATIMDGVVLGFQNVAVGIQDLIGSALFGDEEWEDIKIEAESRGLSLPGYLWDSFVRGMTESWVGLKQFIIDTIFGSGTWDTINSEGDTRGVSLSSAIWEGFKRRVEGLSEDVKQTIISWLPDPIKNLLGLTEDAGAEHGKSLQQGLERGGSGTANKGSGLINQFIQGIYGQRYNLANAINYMGNIASGLSTIANNAYTWGQNLGASLANGIANSRQFVENAVNYVNNLISNFWRSYSPPKQGVLKDIDKWGENLTRTFAGGVSDGSVALMSAIEDINKLVGNSLTSVELGEIAIAPVSGGIGTNISAQADQASIPAIARADQAANQAQAQPAVVKNYNIQPGTMIASRGEIRSFVRMLKEYEDFESQR